MHKEPVHVEYETKYQNLLARQEKRLQDAWTNVVSVLPDTDWDTFSYHWLILNTRSFFYVKDGEKPPEDWNDAIALVPFADYFNHVDDAVSGYITTASSNLRNETDTIVKHCTVNFDGEKYTFKATQQYGNYQKHRTRE